MSLLKTYLKLFIILFTGAFLTACDGYAIGIPPIFTGNLEKYAVDNGSNVYFTVTVLYNPTSVTCFSTNVVTMSNTATNEWSGTANYINNLPNRPGNNPVICTATNAYGTITSNVGFIELIPNIAPNIVIIQPLSICGSDGTLNYNFDLIKFPDTTNVTGAHYTLTQGTLPNGLGVDYYTGKLTGTTPSGDHTVNSLKITATTVAGFDESAPFSISINDAPCP